MNLLIRADANHKIGNGHVMRCIALAQTWKDRGGSVTFLSCCDSNSLRQRIVDEGFEFIRIEKSCPEPADIDMVLKKISAISQQKSNGTWFVLDGYHFNSKYQRAIREAGHRLLVIDDTAHLDYYFADIILNQNIGAVQSKYSCSPQTRLLLGNQYVLLRSEFMARKEGKRQIPERVRHVLVTLGGSDPQNLTLQIVNVLKKFDISDIEVKIVAGASNLHTDSLKAAVSDKSATMNVLDNVNNMANLMAEADVAVSAGGSTCWELAYMGVPAIVVVLAENQCSNAEHLAKAGFAINHGKGLLTDTTLKKSLERIIFSDGLWAQMARKGQALIDGKGRERVVSAMAGDRVLLRKVREDDCKLLWEWANEKDVRKWSFSSDPIAWRDHQKWFVGKLKDPNCVHFVATNMFGNAVGQIRFDLSDDSAEAHITVAREVRGCRIGSRLIRAATDKLKYLTTIKYVRGHVMPENRASIRTFETAGYQEKGIVLTHGVRCIRMETRLNFEKEKQSATDARDDKD